MKIRLIKEDPQYVPFTESVGIIIEQITDCVCSLTLRLKLKIEDLAPECGFSGKAA